MSGIAGLYHLDGRAADSIDMTRMTDAMSHRGPDGAGHWREDSVSLGHLMLHTTPESLHETLPLTDRSGHFTITADARIDNRAELLRQLGVNGKPTEEIADSELILAAYKKWGKDCPDKLLGAFAFAIWDGRRKQLFCARDHFGVKPFYYYHAPGEIFAFSSEIKALLTLEKVHRTINKVRIAEHMLVPVEKSAADTFYEDVHAIEPAHVITLQHGDLRSRRYWSLDPDREIRLGSDKEYAKALRELFTKSVRCRMRSTHPLGSMLSGGLDSSAVTSTAALLREEEHAGPEGPIHTHSAVFDEVTECDERHYISTVLKRYDNLEPYYFHADQHGPLEDYEQVVRHMDQANGAANHYLNWNLYHAANQRGARVVLDGFDGDTTLSHGRRRIAELAYQGRFWTLLKEVRAYQRNMRAPWKGAVWKWAKHMLSTAMGRHRPLRYMRRGGRALANRTKGFWQEEDSDKTISSQKVWHAVLKDAFLQEIKPELADDSSAPRTERAHHYQRLTRVLMARTLESLDAMAAAASVELRLPFFDKRLIEFCLGLPAEQKMNDGYTRLIMRRAMEGILPEKIQWRPGKTKLGPSFDHGLRTHEQERLVNMMLHNTGNVDRYVDLAILQEAHQHFTDEKIGEPQTLMLWRALSLALWLQHTGLSHDPEHSSNCFRRKIPYIV